MFSRGVEYKIDELNKKVKLIHEKNILVVLLQ